jgi:hypothetical protein
MDSLTLAPVRPATGALPSGLGRSFATSSAVAEMNKSVKELGRRHPELTFLLSRAPTPVFNVAEAMIVISNGGPAPVAPLGPVPERRRVAPPTLTRLASPRTVSRPVTSIGLTTSSDDDVDVPPLLSNTGSITSRVHIRKNIMSRMDALRSNESTLTRFTERCGQLSAAKAAKAHAELEAIRHRAHKPLPFEERVVAVHQRRHDALTQHVMDPSASSSVVVPNCQGDTLRLRQLSVIASTALAMTAFCKLALLGHLSRIGHRNPRRALPCLDPRLPLEHNLMCIHAVRVLDRKAMWFALQRRVRVRRQAIAVVRHTLRVSAYFKQLRTNVKVVRDKVKACQRYARRWLRRREMLVEDWRDQWDLVDDYYENGPYISPEAEPWYRALVRQTLLEQHRRYFRNWQLERRRVGRVGQGASRRSSVDSMIPQSLKRSDLLPLIERCQRTMTQWITQTDSGIVTFVQAWDKHFEAKVKPLLPSSPRRKIPVVREELGSASDVEATSFVLSGGRPLTPLESAPQGFLS